MNPRNWMRMLFPTAHRLLVNKALRSLAYLDFNNVLIVGAGFDPYRRLFKEPNRYHTLDIKLTQGVTDVIADAHALPFEDECFDCLLASEVLEHLRSPGQFVNEATRVLKTEGKMILTVPFLFHKHGDPYDFWRPTDHAIRELFKDFQFVEIKPVGNALHVISDLITTAFYPYPVFVPFRIFNHLLMLFPQIEIGRMKSHAASGYLVCAIK